MTYNLGSATRTLVKQQSSQALVDDFRIYDNAIEQIPLMQTLNLIPVLEKQFLTISHDGNTIASTNNQDIRLNATKFPQQQDSRIAQLELLHKEKTR